MKNLLSSSLFALALLALSSSIIHAAVDEKKVNPQPFTEDIKIQLPVIFSNSEILGLQPIVLPDEHLFEPLPGETFVLPEELNPDSLSTENPGTGKIRPQ